ncbi:hypothetical protein JOQ06_019674, partial [Pogonophryne albipinna]
VHVGDGGVTLWEWVGRLQWISSDTAAPRAPRPGRGHKFNSLVCCECPMNAQGSRLSSVAVSETPLLFDFHMEVLKGGLEREETCLPEAPRSDRYPQYFSGQTFANRIPCCAKENNVFLRSKIQSITSSVRTE